MKLLRKVGTTSEIWQIFIQDSSSTTGAGLTGLTNASSGLVAYYHRDTDTTATAISLVSMTVGTFTSSGFKEIDGTNMPGWYQFCPPNTTLASGAKSCAFHLKGATNMAPLPIEVDLDGQVDVTFWNGTVVATPATAGIPDVNAKNINNVPTTSVTTINANQGTTQPVNFTGTGGSALAKVDAIDWASVAITSGSIPAAVAGAAGGLFIAGSNAATTVAGLTTGALTCTTITASGAVAFQSTFAVTTSTSLSALSCTTLTASGAVAFQSTFAVTTSTALAALSCTTLTASGAVAFQSTFTVTGAVAFSSTFAVTTSTSLAALSCTTLTASGAVAFQTTFTVTGTTSLAAVTTSGTVTMNAFTVSNATTLTGAVSLGSTLSVTGTTTLAALNTGAIGTGNVTITGTLSTSGTTTFNALTVSNATTLSGAVSLGSTLVVTGTTTLAALNIGAIGTGNVTITGTLSTTGTVTFNAFTVTNAFVVSGATTLTGAVTATNAGNDIRGVTVSAGAITSVVTVTGNVNGNVGGNVSGTVGGIAGTTQTLDALQTAISATHGAGSWATATGFAVPGDAMALTAGAIILVSASTAAAVTSDHGAGSYITATGFAVPGSQMTLDLSQSVPTTNADETVGDALNAARGQGFGAWAIVGNILNLYAEDGTTVIRAFTLAPSGSAATSRTPV